MYFIPHKTRFFSYVAHVPCHYRYIFTISVIAVLIALSYGLYLMMEQLLQRDQCMITQLQQQYNQLCHTERVCDLRTKHALSLQDQFACYSFAAENDFIQKQFAAILEEAKKQNVQVAELSLLKQADKPWYQCQHIQLQLVGSLSNITQMLAALRASGLMIACKDFSCQRTKDSLYTAQCQLRSISSPK